MADEKKPQGLKKAWFAVKPFLFAGLSGSFATSIIQPSDTVKVRIQVADKATQNLTASKIIRDMVRKEGVSSFYAGLSAAILRQFTYKLTSLGVYNSLVHRLSDGGRKDLPVYQRIGIGFIGGICGGTVGTPMDIILVRMQADKTLPPELRRNYKHVFDALGKMAKQDGLSGRVGMLRGWQPTVLRAMSLTTGMMVSYDLTRNWLMTKTDKPKMAMLGASAVSGMVCTIASLPFDFLKTRLQQQASGPGVTLRYRHALDCAVKVIAQEGPMTFYKGFWTYFVRIGPHAFLTLIILENLKSLAAKFE